jgi:uncharacterized membrane protein
MDAIRDHYEGEQTIKTLVSIIYMLVCVIILIYVLELIMNFS